MDCKGTFQQGLPRPAVTNQCYAHSVLLQRIEQCKIKRGEKYCETQDVEGYDLNLTVSPDSSTTSPGAEGFPPVLSCGRQSTLQDHTSKIVTDLQRRPLRLAGPLATTTSNHEVQVMFWHAPQEVSQDRGSSALCCQVGHVLHPADVRLSCRNVLYC